MRFECCLWAVSRMVKAAASWNMKEKLYEDLRDPSYGAAYINEALLEGDEVVFKTTVADVIRARGVGKVAELAGVNRVTVFKTLKPETRTSFTTYPAIPASFEKRAMKRVSEGFQKRFS